MGQSSFKTILISEIYEETMRVSMNLSICTTASIREHLRIEYPTGVFLFKSRNSLNGAVFFSDVPSFAIEKNLRSQIRIPSGFGDTVHLHVCPN